MAVGFAVVLAPCVVEAKPQAVDLPGAAELRAEYEGLSAAYAETAPGWRPVRPASGSLLFVAPDQYSGTEPNGDRNRAARNKYADELFELAKQAAEAGQLSLAFEWATEAVRENPDHSDARRVLGYERHDGQWLTPFPKRMVDAGKDWDPKSGWIAAGDADKVRKPGKGGWQVRTDHFLVTSNLSQEAAAEMAARLERLHQIWRQLFAGFYLSDREVRELFAGERHRPFHVFYHRDKDDYVAALQRRQPRIAETLGIYFDSDREAHFFAGDERNTATLNHEAVHQLFQETRPAARHVGETANFWIVEGIATYFETLREHRDPAAGLYYTIGESTAGRLPAARERLLTEKFYVSLDELTRLGKDDLQSYPELAKLYSQSAGLAALLMDGEEGRYREPLVVYLSAVYAGRDEASSLSAATGTSNAELDAAYRRYLESLP
ncbi:MAG: hypothetical protein WD971_12080 [Pirellulales bacterium]